MSSHAAEKPTPFAAPAHPRLAIVDVPAVGPSASTTAVDAVSNDASPLTPPSGWYPDPNGGGLLRWWSGEKWTSVVRPPVTAVLTAPPAAAAIIAEPASAEPATALLAEPLGVIDTNAEYGWEREAAGRAERNHAAATLAAEASNHRSGWAEASMPGRSHTVSIWIMAFLPYFQVVALALVLTQVGIDQQALLLAAGGFYLVNFVLAIRDSGTLRRAGYERAPQSLWALLGPLPYFIARAVAIKRHNGTNTSALWVWVINVLLIVGLAVGLALTVGKPYLQYFGVTL